MKSQLLKGTIILTAAGIITRLIGFVYRIFLAGSLGETKLGVYQLIFPVYSICFTIYAAGIQTAVSQMISHEKEENHSRLLQSGLLLSLSFSIPLSFLLYHFAPVIAVSFLGTEETIPLLRILCIIFPFCGITSIINGYFYGISNAKIPAITQIIEQLVRVGFVFLFSLFVLHGNLSTGIAVWGLVLGEFASNLFNIYHVRKARRKNPVLPKDMEEGRHSPGIRFSLRRLLALSVPLTANKLILSLLGSIESVLIPAMLMKYGYNHATALAVFGILTGVVMPFITFPGTITNSLSVLLLPAISHASGRGAFHEVQKTTAVTIRYSLLLGVLTSTIFLNYGVLIGTTVFHSDNAGKLLTALAFLCPFLYVSTTLNSIINGLGKTSVTFLNSILGLSVRIFFLLVVTPRQGIYGYLLGMIFSQIFLCLLDGGYLVKNYGIKFHLMNHLIWPYIFCAGILYLSKIAGIRLAEHYVNSFVPFLCLIPALFFILLYMHVFNLVKWKEVLPR